MSGFTTALNTKTNKLESVPERWVDNPHIFKGVYITPPAPDADAPDASESAPDPAVDAAPAKRGRVEPAEPAEA